VKRAVLLVDHGSRRDEANAVLEALAERLRARVPGRVVCIAHMELSPPDVAAGLAECAAAGAEEVVVIPYFLGPGRHTSRDIPRLVAEAAAAHPALRICIGEPLGVHDKLVDVILERIEQAD
jgi:sirohydrochlorin ferrochelatase